MIIVKPEGCKIYERARKYCLSFRMRIGGIKFKRNYDLCVVEYKRLSIDIRRNRALKYARI